MCSYFLYYDEYLKCLGLHRCVTTLEVCSHQKFIFLTYDKVKINTPPYDGVEGWVVVELFKM